MSNVGYATLTIIPSAKGFASALGGQTAAPLAKAGKRGGALLGGGIVAAAGPALAGLAAYVGVSQVAGFFGSAIKEASNLGESVNALNVTYGEHSAGIQKLGQQAAQSLGLSNTQFNGLAVQFSGFSKTIAGSGGDVVGTLESITGRAADFASVMNLDVAEAASLFQSGLAGETEPLRRFGLDLSAATVAQYAYANGIAESGAELTEAQKVQARYGALMEKTAQTQGDFAATSDSLANVQRRLGASWSDLQGQIGQAFLPILEKLLGFVNSTVMPGLSAFAATVGPVLSGAFSAVGPVLGEVGGALGGLLPMLSPLNLAFQALQPVLPTLVALLATLGETLAGALMQAATALAPLFQSLVATLSGVFVAILPTLVSYVSTLTTTFASLIPIVLQVIAAVVPLVQQLVERLAPIFVELVQNVLPPVARIMGALVEAIAPLIVQIAEFLIPIIEALLPVVEVVFRTIADVIGAVMTIVEGIIDVVLGLISGNWEQVWGGVEKFLGGIWDLIQAQIRGALGFIQTAIHAVLVAISANWNAVWNGISTFLGGIWDGIVGAVEDGIGGIGEWLGGLWDVVMDALSGIGTWLIDAGADLIQGFIDGITGMIGGVGDAIGGVMDFVGGFFPHSPAERGPFSGAGWRALKDSGLAIGDQFGLGLQSSDAMSDPFGALTPTAPEVQAPTVSPGGVTGALAAYSDAAAGLQFSYTQIGGQGLTGEQEVHRAGRRLKQSLRR